MDTAELKARFEYNGKGYVQAMDWLKETGEWERILEKGFSCDGWSVVHEANAIWRRKQEENGN